MTPEIDELGEPVSTVSWKAFKDTWPKSIWPPVLNFALAVKFNGEDGTLILAPASMSAPRSTRAAAASNSPSVRTTELLTVTVPPVKVSPPVNVFVIVPLMVTELLPISCKLWGLFHRMLAPPVTVRSSDEPFNEKAVEMIKSLLPSWALIHPSLIVLNGVTGTTFPPETILIEPGSRSRLPAAPWVALR